MLEEKELILSNPFQKLTQTRRSFSLNILRFCSDPLEAHR